MPHETADTSCPKCGSDTIEDPKTFLTCPKCGAKGSWFDMYGSTDQGFHDGPITVHDGRRWLEDAVAGVPGSEAPPPLYWLSLPPDPQ